MTQIGVIGLWHLGMVSAATLSDMGYQVVGYDQDEKLLVNLRKGQLPVYEPGLSELVQKQQLASRLIFVSDYREAVSDSQVVLLTYDTPVDEKDCVDLAVLHKTFEQILPHLRKDGLVVVNSQVPVGSCEAWQKMIDNQRSEARIDLIYAPENIRLGQAIELFRNPDFIVIGSNTEAARMKAEKLYKPFKAEKYYVSWKTAEMAKHALNAFFATSISFANELGRLCDAVGADGIQISEILKKDSRIGKKAQVRPGLGFSGATLARDLRGLQRLGKEQGVPTLLVNSVLDINQHQVRYVVECIERYFNDDFGKRTLTIFGLTYKPNTSTLRRSVSLEIIRALQTKGFRIQAHDPRADLTESPNELTFNCSRDPYEATRGSDGILLFTDWPEYRELDYGRIKESMRDSLILDTKHYLDGDKLRKFGFTYVELGRGQLPVREL